MRKNNTISASVMAYVQGAVSREMMNAIKRVASAAITITKKKETNGELLGGATWPEN